MLIYVKIIFYKISVFSFFILVVSNCSCLGDKTSHYLKKAERLLKNEKFSKSEFFMHKAYESTFLDEMFPLGRDLLFSKIKKSNEAPILVISVLEQKKKSLFVYNYVTKKKVHFSVSLGMLEYSLSFNGEYIVTLDYMKEKHECTFSIYHVDLVRNQMKVQHLFSGLKIGFRIGCLQLLGVSNNGFVAFRSKNKLLQFDITTQKVVPIVNEVSTLFYNLVSLDKIFTYKTFFYYLKENVLLFTIGNAGRYNLYRYANSSLEKLNSKVSVGNILYTSNNVLLIREGSAGKYFFRIYDYSNPFDLKRIGTIQKVSFWKGISFLEEDSFTYVIDEVLVQKINNIEKTLPFFAIQTNLVSNKDLFFISKIGSFIHYSPSMHLTEESVRIFNKLKGITFKGEKDEL